MVDMHRDKLWLVEEEKKRERGNGENVFGLADNNEN